MFDLKTELKNLPDAPGVYLMHDKNDVVIYVGKAKVLKKRVRQYFQNSANHTPKVRAMVGKIAYFEYIITDSEMEALVLECNLIKKYMPHYNILLKDDKQYPYIKVTMNEDYPRIFMTRTRNNDGARYYGPYLGSNTIKNTLDIIQKIFMPPTCKRKFPQDIKKGRPCLNYHINQCFAPCLGQVSKQAYRAIFHDICAFLEGDHKTLLKDLQMQMKEASLEMEFEKAAALRDKIRAIGAISEEQKIVDSNRRTDMDLIAVACVDTKAFVEVFFVRGGKVLGHENFRMDHAEDLSKTELITDFVKQFYLNAAFIPKEVLLECELSDALVERWLSEKSGRAVHVRVPVRGEKKRMMEMVKKNARTAADHYQIELLKEEEKSKATEQLQELLGVSVERIEAYDISNTQGSENVGAMVVFQNGKPNRSAYRKFKIQSFSGADDYAAMKEVLYRRFRNALEEEEAIAAGTMTMEDVKFLPHPDCIFVDGGKGHVAAANEILEQMELEIPVFGMVKDDKHRTRGLVHDRGEVGISRYKSVFHFITRIQDEVHRVAISYHRKLHKKEGIRSELDGIQGIGPKRRAALLAAFGSIETIKGASVEELREVPGMDQRAAEAVWQYFHLVNEG